MKKMNRKQINELMDYDFEAYQAMYLFKIKDFMSKYSPAEFAIILVNEPNINLAYLTRLKIMMMDFAEIEAYEYSHEIQRFLLNHQTEKEANKQ